MKALLLTTLMQVGATFARNWPYLLLAVLISAAMKLYINRDQMARWLHRYRKGSVWAATGVAVATPLCSCGSMALILGMMASAMPWAPIVAFMVASPLTSPQELFYSAGLFGWPFALAFFAASIFLGLAGGFMAHLLQTRGWLENQARFLPVMGGNEAATIPEGAAAAGQTTSRPGLSAYLVEAWQTGRRLLLLFAVFAFVGYFLNNLVPQSWIAALFSPGKSWGVPLAATLGLPLYLNTEASLPLVRAFMDHGASPGAALAFLITGAGTSVGALSGALAIARWRVVGLVVATLWAGALIVGYSYNALLAAGLL